MILTFSYYFVHFLNKFKILADPLSVALVMSRCVNQGMQTESFEGFKRRGQCSTITRLFSFRSCNRNGSNGTRESDFASRAIVRARTALLRAGQARGADL